MLVGWLAIYILSPWPVEKPVSAEPRFWQNGTALPPVPARISRLESSSEARRQRGINMIDLKLWIGIVENNLVIVERWGTLIFMYADSFLWSPIEHLKPFRDLHLSFEPHS